MKNLVFSLVLLFGLCAPAFAEKIPVRIAPAQIISTHHDEVEVGDNLEFMTIEDVYKNGEIYIKKYQRVVGVVDFFYPNGWAGDSAIIKINKFYTTDVNNKKITVNYPIEINGRSARASDVRYAFIEPSLFYWLFVIRGAEIYLDPDTKMFNLFIEG